MFSMRNAAGRLFLAVTAGLTGCSVSVPVAVTKGTSAAEIRDDPSEELKRQADAMTRTLFEAAAVGAAISGVAGLATGSTGKPLAVKVASGGAAGLATGGYVGFLQKKYADSEARLAHVQRELEQTNANALASIQTLQRLVARRRAALASESGASTSEDSAQAERLIAGYERRRADFAAARSLQLVGAGAPELDPQIVLLAQRIAAMREVARILAETG